MVIHKLTLYCPSTWNRRGLKIRAVCGLEFEVLFQNWGLKAECHKTKTKPITTDAVLANQTSQPISNHCTCKTKTKVVVLLLSLTFN